MKVCGQREDAEDTMQEVLLKALPFESPRASGVAVQGGQESLFDEPAKEQVCAKAGFVSR